MMEQHPIPQQISSYEFKLVGEMTLKQFLKAAGGIVLAVIINATNLIFFIKWPLMLITGGGGLMLAFVPFQDRPLEQWVMAFIRAIYSPTIYTYKKIMDPKWLAVSTNYKEPKKEEKDEALPVNDRSRMEEFLKTLPGVKTDDDQIEINEKPIIINPETTETKKVEEVIVENKTDDTATPTKSEDDWREQKTNLNLKKEVLEATGQAVFGEIPMPDKPDIPNLLVGMVTNNEGKIVEGAIVEIQDNSGNPVRVLKTNALGQFRATTPLSNGRYLIITEHENEKFDRVNVDLSGITVDPIKIKAVLV